jgi:hypothetical protein
MSRCIGPIYAALAKIFGGMAPYAIARSLARDIITEAGIVGPPFDPFKVAQLLGVPIEYSPIEAEGVFSGNPVENPKIVLPQPPECLLTTARRRLNFTLAHELGHFAIRRTVYGFVPLSVFSTEDPQEEVLCGVFASELLMPRQSITSDFRSLGLSPEAFCRLTDRYEVSLTALLCRSTEIWRGRLVTALWSRRDDGFPTLKWVYPKQHQEKLTPRVPKDVQAFRMQDMLLCDTGHTTVERALSCDAPQTATDEILIAGKRMRWHTTSMRLPGSGLILSIMRRDSIEARKALPNEKLNRGCMTSFRTPQQPIQQFLPFTNLSPMCAARKRRGRPRT